MRAHSSSQTASGGGEGDKAASESLLVALAKVAFVALLAFALLVMMTGVGSGNESGNCACGGASWALSAMREPS